jgi:hypothetical protein
MKGVSWRDYVDTRFSALEKATSLALTEREKAIDKAEKGIGERLVLLNELRGGVPTKEQFEALSARFADLKERLDRYEGAGSGMSALWGYIAAAVATGVAIAALFIK